MRMTAKAAMLAGAIALLAIPGTAQKATGPKARYQMDVSTATGFGAMGQQGRGGGLGAALSMMRGGGNSETRSLDLRLGSVLAAPAPAADHFMPTGMQLGTSVPLATPVRTPATPITREPPEQRDFQRPKGRMLIFWGCGPTAGPGQPVIIDFAKIAEGQIPPGLFTSRVLADRSGPSEANSRTYGYWPNDKGRRVQIGSGSSLIGDHRVAGNYSPEIKFALSQDFMAGLRVQTVDSATGATNVSWNAVPSATGYYAHGIGFSGQGPGGGGDIIWWTSSARQEFGGALTDWIAPATVSRLIGEKVVMPPTQTQCQIPAEVKRAGGKFMMLSMYAYGPEANFAFPPRPANPKIAWNPEWTARVRYRSTTTKMVGMPGMGDASDGDDRGSQSSKPRKCGILQRAAGLC